MAIQTVQSTTQNSSPEAVLTPEEMAAYSRDMLLALRSMAEQNRHRRLAELLKAAAIEAGRLGKTIPERVMSRK